MKNAIPRLCIIGHTEYSLRLRSKELTLPFGEVNNARKLQKTLKDNGVPVTEVLDLFELFEIKNMDDELGTLFLDMVQTNLAFGKAGIDFITDYSNDLVKTFLRNVEKITEGHDQNVLLFLSWIGRSLSVLGTGVQKKYPVIGKEDSYIRSKNLAEHFPLDLFMKEIQILISESLLGAVNCHDFNIPLNQFLLVPNLAPPESERYVNLSEAEKQKCKTQYIQRVIEKNKKNIPFDKDTILIGCPYRFVRRKNVDLLIEAVSELYREFPNILLVLKGDLDSEFDIFSMYSEKLHQLLLSAEDQPWFLWDREMTPYPDVLEIFSSYDICPLLSGAELGSNTVVEMCSLGVPTLLVDATVNPYLYNDMAQFVKGKGTSNSTWIYVQPDLEDLKDKLKELIVSPAKRQELGKRGRRLAQERFGVPQLVERMTFASKAAWSLFHNDQDSAHYKQVLTEKLIDDFRLYRVKHID